MFLATTPVIGPSQTVKDALKDISVQQKLINGTQILTIYYVIIMVFFVMDIIVLFDWNKKTRNHIKISPFKRGIINIYRSYRKHGLITLNVIIWMICVGIIIWNIGFEFRLIFAITISILIFTIFMKIAIKIFVNKDSYEDDSTIRAVNLICYILLGNFFCFYMTFISAPNLLISFAGLTLALLLCYYIMLHAIFNPQILQKNATSYMLYSEAFGLIKGMLAILTLMLTTLFAMLYCCYITNPAFFVIDNGEVLDSWDLLYFLIISFTTIGFGDIVPFRLDGMFYSYFVAILIGVSSLFTTTCFVAAIISTANSIAKTTRERFKDYVENPHPLIKEKTASEESETDKLKRVFHEVLNEYEFSKRPPGFSQEVAVEEQGQTTEAPKKSETGADKSS